MTQIETIIAEIERLKADYVPKVNEEYRDFANLLLDIVVDSINSLHSEQSSEGLEEAAKEYVKENCILPEDCNDGDIPYYEECNAAVFKHGANWQKEQMMKSAIDAIITSRWKGSHVCLTTNKDIPQIYNGDRVKIQIIKEDEQ